MSLLIKTLGHFFTQHLISDYTKVDIVLAQSVNSEEDQYRSCRHGIDILVRCLINR